MKKIILFILLGTFAFADLTYDLKNAIKKNDLNKVSDLLDKGAIPDADIMNELLNTGKNELYIKLLNFDIDLHSEDSENISIFSNACMYGNVDIVERLIKKGAEITDKSFYLAIQQDNADVVEFLIKNGEDVNKAEAFSFYTPLMKAAYYNSKNSAEILIKNGADINEGFKAAITTYNPVLVSCARNSKDVLDILIKNNVDLNVADFNGLTPMIYAAANNAVDCMKLLLKSNPKIDLDQSSNNTYNALLFAAARGSKEAVEFLVLKGADIEYTDKNGKTALMIAKAKNKNEVVKYLESKGIEN